MADIPSPRKIRVYDYGESLKIFVGERALAYTVRKDQIKDMAESAGGILGRIKGIFRRD